MADSIHILKRDGTKVDYSQAKVENAVWRAMEAENKGTSADARCIADHTSRLVSEWDGEGIITVEDVQDYVEIALMYSDFPEVAKAYILYRNKKTEERKRSLFKKRVSIRPYEYPELRSYVDAIRHSYWLHTEFNYTSDIQDFKVNTTKEERSAIERSMLAIAQIEVAVKTFWGDIYKVIPKPEISDVGATFADSEARHTDAYAHLLDILGLGENFEKLIHTPVIRDRIRYLTLHNDHLGTGENSDFALALLLFSLFIEHVSLFSQFLIIMSFNKHKNMFKGMSNAIEATSKEEELHGQFGIDLINIIREEHPEWFDEDFKERVYEACLLAYESEDKIIDWIYEEGDLDFLPKSVVKEFIKNRLNNSLESVGYERILETNDSLVELTDWFNDEVVTTKHGDFFVKRSINYNKRSKSITEDDLF